ncbi:abortive infection family protein [Flavobacterium sp.]|jgi:hypothetical protein|uniref:abortive infection family protein n=1 Tax=Flavobacterium sp. TaxID=239 RepID=UPI0037C15754
MSELQISVEAFQNLLIDVATNQNRDNDTYIQLRKGIISNEEIKSFLPDFVFTARTVEQFWQYIKLKFSTYPERREFIWNEFSKVLNYLEIAQNDLVNESVSSTLVKFNQDYINSEWRKAMERKSTDPEAAITTARTLIETTCKFILDDLKVEYEDDLELPKLYKITSEKLNLAPDQHTEQIFKQILSGCQTVINGLGALRNKLSDSHGKKTISVKPLSRHAELAVNLAGTMTIFLLETYEQKTTK